ncbi:hypothetical protein AYO49_02430 [Verrucomicrobiaceae bacterium SCGC AG-212-N21]|nr:hypothetical protein AYO49_02430 [Verrucomicrobiaceae bacterium SCGC AG-212-N21]
MELAKQTVANHRGRIIATDRDAAAYVFDHMVFAHAKAEAACLEDGWVPSRVEDFFPFSAEEHVFWIGFMENEYFVNYGNVTNYERWTEDEPDNIACQRVLYAFHLLGFRHRVEAFREMELKLPRLRELEEHRWESDEADSAYCAFREELELLPGETYEEGYSLLVNYYRRHEAAFSVRLPP